MTCPRQTPPTSGCPTRNACGPAWSAATHPGSCCFTGLCVRARSAASWWKSARDCCRAMGAEARVYNPSGLPLPDDAPDIAPQGGRTARARSLGRGHGVVLARAARRHDRHHESADRLDPVVGGRRAPHTGQDAGGHAGLRRIAVVQRRQPDAGAGPLDADDHHPQPVLGRQGVSGIRRPRPHEALALLRPHRRCDARSW